MSQPNGKSAATTFRADEVRLMVELFAVLNRGGDPSALIRSASYASVMRKLHVMKARIGELAAGGKHG